MAACWLSGVFTAHAITVDAPVLVPDYASSATNLSVTVTCPTVGATIHYTLNGLEPTVYDPTISSGGTLTIRRNILVKVKAWVGVDSSPTAVGDFDITGETAAGWEHVVALKSSGAVFAWGSQQQGRLGNNILTNTNQPSPVESSRSGGPITDAVAVAAGSSQSIILDSNGNPWGFGFNTSGQLGNNTTTNAGYAQRVVKSTTSGDWLTDCVAVATGQFFSGALGSDGKVYTWGANSSTGQLGNGSTVGQRHYAGAVQTSSVVNLTNIQAIDFGDSQGLALATDGKVWGWGSDTSGQLGTGAISGVETYAVKMQLASSTDMTDVTATSTGNKHSAVVRWKTGDATLQGSVWSVGNQQHGRLGNGVTTNTDIGYPVRVLTSNAPAYLSGIVQVSAGSAHTLALDETGQIWAWGYNGRGALGDNTTTNSAYAIKVKDPAGTGFLSDIAWISAGGTTTNNFSIAVANDGKVYAWGFNTSGQLATGSTSTGANPLPMEVTNFKLTHNSPDVALSANVTQDSAPGSSLS